MHETLKLKDLSFEVVCAIIAQVVHAANRQYVETIGGSPVNPTWEGLPERKKQGLIKAIRATIGSPRTLEESHAAWCDELKAQGYTRAGRIDHIRKTHPSLVRFNELPFEEQLKDALFLGITSIFASALGLGEPIDEIDEYTTAAGPGTVGEAAEAAQEKLDNIPTGQDPEITGEAAEAVKNATSFMGPLGGYDPDNPPPDDSEFSALEKAIAAQELLDKQGDGKLKVAPEDVLDPDDLQNSDYVPDEHPKGKVAEPTQAQGPKPNLPDEDVKPAKAKKAKKKK